MNQKNQNYINHIALVLDASDSMGPISSQVIKVADDQIQHLAQRSKELDQETRVTVYTFNYSSQINCVFYDKDVLRLPSLKDHYRTSGMTALVDASLKAIEDLERTPELYGDHAFLVYVLTDGQENNSRKPQSLLSDKIKSLRENWTLACFVPDQDGKFEAKKFGFPTDNIAIWETNARGMVEVGNVIRQATDNYMTNRSVGIRSSKNLFNMNVNVDKNIVRKNLIALHPGQYRIFDVKDKVAIAPFVEAQTKRAYKLGEGYYQLSKPEKVQAQKAVALFDRKSKGVYTGADARKLLGLPDHEVKVAPTSYPDYEVFIQSGSVNRNLMPGTKLLLLS